MIFRVEKTKNYTVMSNYHLREKEMSLKAKGLLSWMLSNNDDWDYSIQGIVASCAENETAIRSALKELQSFGYLEIKKLMPESKDGNIIRSRIEYEYIIHEKPIQEGKIQGVENLGLEFLGVENPVQRNTNKINTKERNKIISKDMIAAQPLSSPKTSSSEFLGSVKKPKKDNLFSKCTSLIDEFTEDEILREMLTEFLKKCLQNSRESGMPFYTNNFKGKLNGLKALSEDNYEQRKIVKQTLDNGWTGFYELKERKERSKGGNININEGKRKSVNKAALQEQIEKRKERGEVYAF